MMIPTIRPHGAINETVVCGIVIERPGRFAVVDDCGNLYGVEEPVFEDLKRRGIKEYVLKQSNNK